MSFWFIFTPGYSRRAARFLKKYSDLFSAYEKPFKLRGLDLFQASLRLHRLATVQRRRRGKQGEQEKFKDRLFSS